MVVQSRGTSCCFPLFLKYCLLREESVPQGHLYDQMGLHGPAWLLHVPLLLNRQKLLLLQGELPGSEDGHWMNP